MVTRRKATRTALPPKVEASIEQLKPARSFSPEAELALLRKALKHPTRELDAHWLDTGDKQLNAVFGSPEKGLRCGRIYELSGFESHGKTAIGYQIASMAQRAGARVGLWDLENSWDPLWATKRGLKADEVIVFEPLIGKFGNEKEQRLITAEEHAEEIELWMEKRHEAEPEGKIFLLVDSIAALETQDMLNAGVAGQNMRTTVSNATYLSKLLRSWQKKAANYNAWIFLINQIIIFCRYTRY